MADLRIVLECYLYKSTDIICHMSKGVFHIKTNNTKFLIIVSNS